MSASHDLQSPGFDPKAYCARLPVPELPPALLDTTLRAYRRRRARRTALLATAAGIAFVAIGVAALRPLVPGEPSPHPPTALTAADAAAIPATSRADALRDIDRSLQAAYDAGASDADVAALWAQRHALAGHGQDSVPLSL